MENISLPLYIGGSLLMYWIIGIKFYLIDRWLGVPTRMLFYRMFNEKPLPEAEQFGFIHHRSGRVKLLWSGAICTTTSALFILKMHSNPVIEVITFFFDTILVFFGFLAGPWAYKTIRGKNKVLEKLDAGHEKIVDGTFVTEVSNRVSRVGDNVLGGLDECAEQFSGFRPLGTPSKDLTQTRDLPKPQPLPKAAPVAEVKEEDPREAIKRFTNGRTKDK